MHDAKAIRKHTAQHDLFNRIHSIAADGAFVTRVAKGWYDNRFEVVPLWDVVLRPIMYAYFKSTDGHTNNWNFNLRRSNLPLAQIAENKGGLVLVDSTRRGKRMPDALSKTVPIWCAVINIALQLRREDEGGKVDEWDTTLYLPPNIVSPSEKAQIQALLPGWAAALETSTLPLPSLSKPLRPFFVHPGTTSPPQIPHDAPFTPIICTSASRWVGTEGDDVPSVTVVGKRTVGYEYVPGAGDDDELWARGLKPALYHTKRDDLLAVDRDDLADVVDDLVASGKELSLEGLSLSGSAVTSQAVGVPDPDSPLAVNIGPPTVECSPWNHSGATNIYIVETDKHAKDVPSVTAFSTSGDLVIAIPDPRTDGNRYRKVLAELVPALRPMLSTGQLLIHPARRQDLDAVRDSHPATLAKLEISTSTHPLTSPEIISARKAILPIALALTCSLRYGAAEIDKSVIADELHHLVSLWPDGNPPRAALKRVNEVLISRDR